MMPMHLLYPLAKYFTNSPALADLADRANLRIDERKDFSVAAILQTNSQPKPRARTTAISSNDNKCQVEMLTNEQQCKILNNILHRNNCSLITNSKSPTKSALSLTSSLPLSNSAPLSSSLSLLAHLPSSSLSLSSSLLPPSLSLPEASLSLSLAQENRYKLSLSTETEKSIPRPPILSNEMRRKRNSKAFGGILLQCPKCSKCFNRNWLLKGHLRTHTGEKPFQCDLCLRRFADNSNLRAHKQTHSEVKRFECGNCHRKFALKSYLSKHKESACGKYRRKF